MKEIIFDVHPLGMYSFSCEAYDMYYKRRYNKNIYFYTRDLDGTYIRVDDKNKRKNLRNRIITFVDFGKKTDEIPFDKEVRVAPLDESYENDEILKNIVEELGENASWKESDLRVIQL